MPFHYIVDNSAGLRHKRYVRKIQVCDLISRMSLALGGMGNHVRRYTEIAAKPYWFFDGVVPVKTEVSKIKLKNIKWYIRNHIPCQGKIWNGSYIHGVAQFGKIVEPKLVSGGRNYPSFLWWSSKKVLKIISFSPFGGNIAIQGKTLRRRWSLVPSLLLPYDEESLSFMAGVLSVGRLFESKGKTLAVYNRSCEKWIRKWGIPIEFKWKTGEICISPFWPALLEEYMPPEAREWRDLRNPIHGSTYAAILWRTYKDEDFKPGKIPYLLGRRSIFYNYGNDELGAMKHLEKMRVEKGLTQLDERFRRLIHDFSVV